MFIVEWLIMSENNQKCPLCDTNAEYSSTSMLGVDRVHCPKCGKFNIDDAVQLFDEDKVKLKYYYRYIVPKKDAARRLQNFLTSENKEVILASIQYPRNLLEKINRVLIYTYERTEYYGKDIILDFDDAETLFFCRHSTELDSILRLLNEYGYIHSSPVQIDSKQEGNASVIIAGLRIIIKAEGIEKALTLTHNINSEQCFVAMWFDEETEAVYKSIEAAIQGDSKVDKDNTEYGAGYKAFKINDKLHANYIPPEIIAEIKRSRFMIADLTGYRGGVYYEAGYAEGMGIPVIYTCSEDWLDDIKDKDNNIIRNGVHFDLKQKNIILWTNDKLGEFQRQLASTIGEIVGFNN